MKAHNMRDLFKITPYPNQIKENNNVHLDEIVQYIQRNELQIAKKQRDNKLKITNAFIHD